VTWKYGSLWQRWTRGVTWTWVNDRYRGRLPEGFDASMMTLETRDRFHEKQGRSTARVVFHAADRSVPTHCESQPRPLSVYLKRQYRLPWAARLAATLNPSGRHSPAASEWVHLEQARALGIEVPEAVAAGEQIGPHGALTSFLMIAELGGCLAINEVLPGLAERLDARAFARLKRWLITEMANVTATLHVAGLFHKDLYLCHFFLDVDRLDRDGLPLRVVLIDLHRLAAHRLWPGWWRWKDLGQLLFSTYGVGGIDDRDRRRFWVSYLRNCPVAWRGWQARIVEFRAARYLSHNRKPR
jgi:heptose I phosphotransferase